MMIRGSGLLFWATHYICSICLLWRHCAVRWSFLFTFSGDRRS